MCLPQEWKLPDWAIFSCNCELPGSLQYCYVSAFSIWKGEPTPAHRVLRPTRTAAASIAGNTAGATTARKRHCREPARQARPLATCIERLTQYWGTLFFWPWLYWWKKLRSKSSKQSSHIIRNSMLTIIHTVYSQRSGNRTFLISNFKINMKNIRNLLQR